MLPKLLLRALAASVLSCLLSSETVLIGPAYSSLHGNDSSLKILKCVGWEEGEQEEVTLVFSWKMWHFHQTLIQQKLLKGETKVLIWKCCCNAAWKSSLGWLLCLLFLVWVPWVDFGFFVRMTVSFHWAVLVNRRKQSGWKAACIESSKRGGKRGTELQCLWDRGMVALEGYIGFPSSNQKPTLRLLVALSVCRIVCLPAKLPFPYVQHQHLLVLKQNNVRRYFINIMMGLFGSPYKYLSLRYQVSFIIFVAAIPGIIPRPCCSSLGQFV